MYTTPSSLGSQYSTGSSSARARASRALCAGSMERRAPLEARSTSMVLA